MKTADSIVNGHRMRNLSFKKSTLPKNAYTHTHTCRHLNINTPGILCIKTIQPPNSS